MAPTKVTRRAALATVATPAVLLAQAPAATATADDSPAQLLAQARQSVVRAHEALARFTVDRALEPAARFEV